MTWPLVKLGDVAPARATKNTFSESEEVWTLNLDQVESGTGKVIKKIVMPISEIGSSTHGFDERHVLYSKLRPYLNKVVLPDSKGLATTELVPLLPDPERLDREYLACYLRSKRFVDWVSAQVAGAKMPRVSMQLFWEHEIPLPPLDHQKRIAATLHKADAIRRKRQQAIQLADEFLRAVFLDMFGDPVRNPKNWQTSHLKKLVEVVSGATPSKSNDSFWNGGFPWVSPKDMKAWEVKSSIDSVSDSAFEKTNLKKLPIGSVLIVVRGMILAHTVPVGVTSVPVAINQDIKAFIPNKEILSEFLVWFLRSQQENLLAKVSSSAHGTKRFEMSDLLNLSVMVPNINLQEKFVRIVRTFQETCDAWAMSEEKAMKFFQSLSQRAFNSKL